LTDRSRRAPQIAGIREQPRLRLLTDYELAAIAALLALMAVGLLARHP
jgi:hypothetical protein